MSLPKIPPINADTITGFLDNPEALQHINELPDDVNISSLLDRMPNDIGEISRAVEDSISGMSPETMKQVRKLATKERRDKITVEMNRRNIELDVIKSSVSEKQKILRGLAIKSDKNKRTILITNNRQHRSRNVPINEIRSSASRIIGSQNIVELSCSRLALGPLQDKTIKVWCEPSCKGKKNKRLSRILGFNISGSALIVIDEGDLNETDFLTAEKLLK